jgi:hypothetical protein
MPLEVAEAEVTKDPARVSQIFLLVSGLTLQYMFSRQCGRATVEGEMKESRLLASAVLRNCFP